MRNRFLVLLLLALSGCGASSCPLCGEWKSDESATVASLRSCGWMTPQRESTFASGFFGRLVTEYEPGRARSYFLEDGPEGASWESYEVVRREDDLIELSVQDPGGATTVRRLELSGECYQTPMGGDGCFETFCRR